MGIFDSVNFFWSHRSWPLLNFSSFSGKCATTLVSGDALLMRLQGYAPSPFFGNVFLPARSISLFRKSTCLLKI
jgi:hypothetical protein